MFTDDSFEKKGFDAETDYDDYIDRIFTFINEKVGTEYFPSDEDEEEVARFKKDFNDEFDEVGQAIEDANDWSWNEILGAETFGAENERVCDYCEREAKDMGMVTFPDGLAVCDICFEEQSGELNAESYSADESLPNFVAFGDGDAISYSQCLTCSKVGDYDDDQELCNSCNMKYDYRYSPVAGFYLNAESFGAESSGLTRLPSDEPNFSPQKADRNKDGEISSWERTVGNKVAKGSEGRKTSSKGIDAFAEPFEEIGISKPYARLGVIAAGITALAFGVNKLRK